MEVDDDFIHPSLPLAPPMPNNVSVVWVFNEVFEKWVNDESLLALQIRI